jgi:hypothetical protein
MKQDLNAVFEDLLKRFRKSVEYGYRKRLKKAKDKSHVLGELVEEVRVINVFLKGKEYTHDITEFFLLRYKRGEDLSDILKLIRKEYGEEEGIMFVATGSDAKKRPEKEIEAEWALKKKEARALRMLAKNEQKLLRFFVKYLTYQQIAKDLPGFLNDDTGDNKARESGKYTVEWTGSKDNKNEFVQLIYGLHQAGLINKGKGEITKIVDRFSEILALDLSKNWQSNHSASIHKAKNNYQPPIFDDIKKAYIQYAEALIEDKKKRK